MNKHELTSKNYFGPVAEAKYFGSSSFKAYDNSNPCFEVFGNTVEGGCEAREVAVMKGEYEKEDKKVFLVGSYVHAAMDSKEAFNELINDHYDEIYTKKSTLRAEFQQAEKMIEVLKNSPIVQNMQNCEHEVIMVGEIAGVEIKIMCDLLDLKRGYIADYKTTKKIQTTSYKNGKHLSFIDVYDYKLQVAIYSEIIRQNVGKWLDFYIIAVDKLKNPDHTVIFMTNGNDEESFIHDKLVEVELKLPIMHLIKTGKKEPKRCETCAYCLSTKKLTGPISLEQFEQNLGL